MIKQIVLWFIETFKKKPYQSKGSALIANTIVSTKDDRDYKPTFVTSEPLPIKCSLLTPPIRNQGATNSCMSHAAVRLQEIQLMSEGRYLEGSELYHYYNARKFVNNTFPNNGGMSVRDGCATSKRFGMALEKAWPWVPSEVNTTPNKSAYWLSSLFPVFSYERLDTLEDIKQSVFEGVPVVIGVWLDKAFYALNRTNYVWNPTTKTTAYGGHAITITGYDDEQGIFIVENSWGTSKGLNGRLHITYEGMSKVSFDWYRIIIKEWR